MAHNLRRTQSVVEISYSSGHVVPTSKEAESRKEVEPQYRTHETLPVANLHLLKGSINFQMLTASEDQVLEHTSLQETFQTQTTTPVLINGSIETLCIP